MIVTAALKLTSFPFAALGYRRFRMPLPAWDGWYLIITLIVELTLAVVSMIAGIACMRHPPRRRKLLIVWAWTTLIAGAASILVRIYFYIFLARAYPYVISAIALDVNNFLAGGALPILCLILSADSIYKSYLGRALPADRERDIILTSNCRRQAVPAPACARPASAMIHPSRAKAIPIESSSAPCP